MPIEILDMRQKRTVVLSLVINAINRAQAAYDFSLLDSLKSTALSFAVRTDTDIAQFLLRLVEHQSIWRGYHPDVMSVFDTAIHSDGITNLFSVDVADQGLSVVTYHNVSDFIIPIDPVDRISAYMIFQFAFFALKFSGGNIPFHPENRDCLFDYRQEKIGIVNAIRKGDICDHCKTLLENQRGTISPDQLAAIFSMLAMASKKSTCRRSDRPLPPLSRIYLSDQVLRVFK